MDDTQDSGEPLITTSVKKKTLFDEEMESEGDRVIALAPTIPKVAQGKVVMDEASWWQRFNFGWISPFIRVSRMNQTTNFRSLIASSTN